ncbi:L-gulonolactone oxidase 3-like [Cryptomeria japonica]|uniref:L-gulonolactone oxidase 3-like n=1 Tax=Cryptomeria japonica TaxID=3369 RepID=UPI0027DA435B|nr:L-gulonolactone oxidase 3-like [Cryptomeria japonica]
MNMMIFLLFILCFTPVSICTEAKVKACPPAPSLQCTSDGCEIFNYQGIWEDRSICKATNVAWPTSEPQLLRAVAHAVQTNQKIKVVSRHAHSLSKLVCVDSEGLIISTQNYDSVIEVNRKAMTITVQSGTMMSDVIEAAAKQGLALPAMTYISGVSAAGVISTGAHGSSFAGKGSGVYEYVVGMRIVVPGSPFDGYAKIITLTEADEDLKAARLALGTLGAISEITFSLRPMFKRSVSVSAIFVANDRVSVDVAGDGSNSILGTPTTVADIETRAYLLDSVQAKADVVAICNLVGNRTLRSAANGYGFLNHEKVFTGYPVVGFNYRMQTSGECEQVPGQKDERCTPTQILDKNETTCSWDRRVHTSLYFDVELRVPLSRFREAMKDVKKIRDLNPERMCDQTIISLRSIKKSEAYLGPTEDLVTMELITYRPREAGTPKWNEDVFEEIEQMVIEKYGGGLHWGKSGGYLFGGLAKRTVSLEGFLKVKERFDPDGVFSNDWTDGLFGIGDKGVEELRDGCALDKLCKCREDSHCAPEKGFLCKEGRVWEYARVCRKNNMESWFLTSE